MRGALLLAAAFIGVGCDGDEGACRSIDSAPPAGGLVITEVMAAPTAGGAAAEWVELRNVLPWTVDPDGLLLASGAAAVVLACDGTVPPGGVFVAAGSPDPAENGGVQDIRCSWSGSLLPDGVQELPADLDIAARTNRVQVQGPDGAVIDDIPYLIQGAGFPTVTVGASIELCAEQLSAASNDHGDAWHVATVAAGISGGDLGTPGMVGFSCGLDERYDGGR